MYYNVKGEKIFYSARSLLNDNILCVSLLGETVPNPRTNSLHRVNPNPKLNMYTFEYVYEGRLIVVQGNQEYVLQKGDLFILHKNASHYFYSDPTAPVGKYFVVCNGVYVDKLMEAFGITDGTVIRQLDFSEGFLHLIDVAENNPYYMHRATMELLLRILYSLNPATYEVAPYIPSPVYPLHQQISSYIISHIQEPLRLDQIASHFSIAPVTLNRIFREHNNTTPKQYILTAKVEVAKQLLSATDLSINRISEFLSFGHQNNFANVFTKITGLSPSQYRKEHSHISNESDQSEEI